MNSLEELRQLVLQRLQDLQSRLVSSLPITDYGGTIIGGVGNPQQPGDVVTLSYLQTALVTAIGAVGSQPLTSRPVLGFFGLQVIGSVPRVVAVGTIADSLVIIDTSGNLNIPGGAVFSVGGASGLSTTRAFGTSLTVNTGSALTSASGVVGLVTTSGTFVTSVTLNTTNNTTIGGILTA